MELPCVRRQIVMLNMRDAGERGFVEQLLPLLGQSKVMINCFGDDVAVVRTGGQGSTVAFSIDRTPYPYAYKHGLCGSSIWGRLCATASFSDILAAGAEPLALAISLMVPSTYPVKDSNHIVLAAKETAEAAGGALVTGDTKPSTDICVVGAAIGIADPENMWSRRGARPGDILAVTGQVGGFMASIVEMERHVLGEWGLGTAVEYLTQPAPAAAEAMLLRQIRGSVTAAIDLSDGLGECLQKLCNESMIGADLSLAQLPIDPFVHEVAKAAGFSPYALACAPGDWGLLVAISPSLWPSVQGNFASRGLSIAGIGTATTGCEIVADGLPVELPRHEHFRTSYDELGKYLEYLSDFLRRS
jgi:thiamine-monophosphate kinase